MPNLACDKYQGLVIGPDGQTVADPFGMLPTMADYEEWRQVADQIITRAEDQLTRGFEEHGALPEEIFQPVEAVRLRWDEMGSVAAQLLAPDNVLWGSTIVSMVDIARDGACQIGLVEKWRVDLGGMEADDIPTPVVPTNGSSSKGGGKGMGLGLVLLLGLAAWGMSRD
jgi:hypothetical protein